MHVREAVCLRNLLKHHKDRIPPDCHYSDWFPPVVLSQLGCFVYAVSLYLCWTTLKSVRSPTNSPKAGEDNAQPIRGVASKLHTYGNKTWKWKSFDLSGDKTEQNKKNIWNANLSAHKINIPSLLMRLNVITLSALQSRTVNLQAAWNKLLLLNIKHICSSTQV